jgi:hypothetical protein
VPDRWLRSGRLWTPTRGVRAYERPSCLVDRLRVFAVAAPGDFAFSHVTTALLLGIPLPIEVEADARVHVMMRTPRNRERRRDVVGHRGLETRRMVHVEGLPVVAPADTWADLGELVGAGKPLGLDDIIVAGDVAARLAGSTCEELASRRLHGRREVASRR